MWEDLWILPGKCGAFLSLRLLSLLKTFCPGLISFLEDSLFCLLYSCTVPLFSICWRFSLFVLCIDLSEFCHKSLSCTLSYTDIKKWSEEAAGKIVHLDCILLCQVCGKGGLNLATILLKTLVSWSLSSSASLPSLSLLKKEEEERGKKEGEGKGEGKKQEDHIKQGELRMAGLVKCTSSYRVWGLRFKPPALVAWVM